MNKKGAIELSMTTVIVIVIGIVLLSLGLLWVRGVFGNVTGISDDAFDHANDLIEGIENFDSVLTIVPNDVEVVQNGDEGFGVIVFNDKQEPLTGLTVRMGSTDEDLDCGFLDGKNLVGETQAFNLNSGDDKRFTAGVKDEGGSLRTTSCRIQIVGINDPDNERTLVVKVIKKNALLG